MQVRCRVLAIFYFGRTSYLIQSGELEIGNFIDINAAVYYVRPTQPRNATCPGDPCLTLDEYAVSSERYFTSNTAFLFLGGNHTLSSSFNVSGIHNLTLKPYTDAISVFVHGGPYIVSLVVASDVVVAELNFKNISFVFENSTSIMLTGLVIVVNYTDPEFMYAGSAITCIGNSTITLQGKVEFLGHDVVEYQSGCGIRLHDCSVLISEGHVTFSRWGGGAISGGGNSTLILKGTVAFNRNIIDRGIGGAITLNESSIANITGNVSFTKNVATRHGVDGGGGAIGLLGNSQLVLNGTVTFTDNFGVVGGAILSAGDSSVILQGNITFIGNSAALGGAIALVGSRTIQLPETDCTLITFANNAVDEHGGALYFSQFILSIALPLHCAFIFEHLPINPVLNFIDNVAKDGGDAIYGAYFQRECITPSGIMHTSDYFPSILNNISLFSPSFLDDPSLISSNAVDVCLCEDGKYNCSNRNPAYSVYPGELLELSAVLAGDMQGLVNGSVTAAFNTSGVELGDLQSIRFQSRNCAKFTYSIFINTSHSVDIFHYISNYHNGGYTTIISLHVLACPVGFTLNRKKKLCDCFPPLLNIGTVSCYISGKSIQRQGTVWIGALQQNTNYTSVIYSNTCPFSYCSINKVNITVNQTHLDQDVQCNDNRAGILCGGCRANYSLALGSNRCLPGCTNNRLSLVIAFAAAGIALVFFIKILNLTVSQGTLNGLIFYANIIGAQPTLVLPTRGSPASPAVSFLSVWERDGNLHYFTGKHIPLMVLALSVLIVLIIPFTFVNSVVKQRYTLPSAVLGDKAEAFH